MTGDWVSVTVSASDTDSGTISYSATNLPDGVTIDPSSGTISGFIAEDAVSTTPYRVTVTATDASSGLSTTQTFSWIVNDSAMALTANTISATEYTDATYTLATFTDTDPNWSASAFSVSVNWGDGTTDDNVGGNAVITAADGTYTITDDHTYTSSGSYAPVVRLSDGFETITATTTATVVVAPLSLTGGLYVGGSNGTVSGEWAYFRTRTPR